METITHNKTPFACEMSVLHPAEKMRVLELLKELIAKRQAIKELPDGFAFSYQMDSDIFRSVAEFIVLERLCCPFFEFVLRVKQQQPDALWFELRGPQGVKDFIKIEFEM